MKREWAGVFVLVLGTILGFIVGKGDVFVTTFVAGLALAVTAFITRQEY